MTNSNFISNNQELSIWENYQTTEQQEQLFYDALNQTDNLDDFGVPLNTTLADTKESIEKETNTDWDFPF